MPLNDENPSSASSLQDQGSDGESASSLGEQGSDGESSDHASASSGDQGSDGECSGRCNSTTSVSDMDISRQSFTSNSSSKLSSPSSSPPKVITLEDVMSSAQDLSNLRLAHEIIVNQDFHVESPNLPENSLEKRVRDIVHRAFWDALESDLNNDPPEYQHAVKLLEEIRETLLSFLNPGANRMRNQIMEVLDMDLIRQQVDQEAVDIQGLAGYIISTMGKFCSPIRDQEIKKLQELQQHNGGIVETFKEIFRVLDLMKLDVVNYTITTLRPELQKQSVDYERTKFQNIVDTTPSALDHTSSWIQSSVEELLSAVPPSAQGKSSKTLPGPIQILNNAYIQTLTWDYSKRPLPETLMSDEQRLRDLQRRLQLLQTVDAVLLVVYAAMGEPIRGLPALAERLKRMTTVLLDGMHSPQFNLKEALESCAIQMCGELNVSLTERGFPALTPSLQDTLKERVSWITEDSEPVRILVAERVQQYFRVLLSAGPNTLLNQVPFPPALNAIHPELTALAGSFVRLVHFNMQVYSPFYMNILKDLLFTQPPTSSTSTSPSPSTQTTTTAAQDPAPSPLTSN